MADLPPPIHVSRRKSNWGLVVLATIAGLILLIVASKMLTPGRVVRVAHGNKPLQDASRKAQAELPTFIDALKHRTDGQRFFVRGNFKTTGGPEYLWVKDVAFDGTDFHGTLDESPMLYRKAKRGDPVTMKRNEVYDWAIKEGSSVKGAYTTKIVGSGG